MVAHFGSRAVVLTCLHILHHGVSSTSTGLQAPPGITLAPSPVVPVSTTSFDVRSSASDLSVAFIGALPLLENWIQTPDAPRVTAVTDALDDILPKALDLLDKLPTPTHGAEPCYNSRRLRCERGASRPKQRSILGGLFETSFSLLNCVVDTTSKVRNEVVKGTKDTVSTAGTIQHILKPMLDALNEVEVIKPSGSPSGSPTSPEATSTSLCTALATITTAIGGLFKRGDGDECTTACAAPVTTPGGTGSTSASTTTLSRFVCAPTCTNCNSKHTQLLADDSILPGYSKAPNGVLVKPSPISTRLVNEDISIKDERAKPTPRKNDGHDKRALSHPAEYLKKHPGDKEYVQSWMLSEIKRSKILAHGQLPLHTTGISEPFFKTPQSWSLVNLYGCTSVIVISHKRMYMAHIWELPTMGGTPEEFQKQALDALEYGDAGTPGLRQFHDEVVKGDFTSSNKNPVHAFIITPFMLPHTDNQPWQLRFQPQVDQIQELLKKVLGSTRPYAVRGPRDIKIIPYVSRTADEDLRYGHGKILIQYDPAAFWVQGENSMVQHAAVELWFETPPTSRLRNVPLLPRARYRMKWKAPPLLSVGLPPPDALIVTED